MLLGGWSIHLGCLVSGHLIAKGPRGRGWKSLDLLGFSRPNRGFSMGYDGFSLKEISHAFPRPGRRPAGRDGDCGKAGLFMDASLT